MAIRTQQSISGFIASDPQLKIADSGKARFYARFGQRHYRATGPGEFEELEATFHDLVIHGKTAERAYELFAKGDSFVAEGYLDRDEYIRDGQTMTGEKFVAKKIGHDTARSTYTVERARREPPARAPEFEPPSRPATNRSHAISR